MADVGLPVAASTTPEATLPPPRIRRGFVTDAGWPFRLDVSVEYQDWLIIAVCSILLMTWCSPCICSKLQNGCSQRFTRWVYTRLHVFYTFLLYLTLFVIMLTIGVLPDWTVDNFLDWLGKFLTWSLDHITDSIEVFCIMFGIWVVMKSRDRILYLTGTEHINVIRFDLWRALGMQTRKRPVELFIWKVEDVASAGTKLLKANDVFVEVHYGDNEPMRTRVHNNAGTRCVLRESLQLNIDESYPSTQLTLLVKDQGAISSSTLGRLQLTTREVCGVEDQTGKRRACFEFSEEFFVSLALVPRGRVWIAIAPVEDFDDVERMPLMNQDSMLLQC